MVLSLCNCEPALMVQIVFSGVRERLFAEQIGIKSKIFLSTQC